MSRTICKKVRFSVSYLDYYKDLLKRVSFCSDLFKKEYHKAREIVAPHELSHLDQWVKNKKFT
ncbi:MAG: hypothetical protein AB8B73_00230 [Ekhidna sp.]